MEFTRRTALSFGAGAVAAAVLPIKVFASTADDAIADFTGGAAFVDGDLTLTTPEIAENGNTVPVSVDAPGAAEILVLATGNPTPEVAKFAFGPLAGAQSASVRIRLAETQEVIAIARMADGSFVKASNIVKVTIGGCGG